MTQLQGTVLSSPIPAYQNLPIESENYKPSVFTISNIQLGAKTTITTTTNHNYVVNQEIRLLIPPTFGCRQLNEQTGYVTSIPAANEVVTTINSSKNVDSYISSSASTKAQIVAIGDISNGQINSNGRNSNLTFIPGSFINISPQ